MLRVSCRYVEVIGFRRSKSIGGSTVIERICGMRRPEYDDDFGGVSGSFLTEVGVEVAEIAAEETGVVGTLITDVEVLGSNRNSSVELKVDKEFFERLIAPICVVGIKSLSVAGICNCKDDSKAFLGSSGLLGELLNLLADKTVTLSPSSSEEEVL